MNSNTKSYYNYLTVFILILLTTGIIGNLSSTSLLLELSLLSSFLVIANLLLTTFVLPVFLVFLNIRYKQQNLTSHILSPIVIILVGILGYIVWGLTSGRLLEPDGMTVTIVYYEISISLILFFIGSWIGWLYTTLKK